MVPLCMVKLSPARISVRTTPPPAKAVVLSPSSLVGVQLQNRNTRSGPAGLSQSGLYQASPEESSRQRRLPLGAVMVLGVTTYFTGRSKSSVSRETPCGKWPIVWFRSPQQRSMPTSLSIWSRTFQRNGRTPNRCVREHTFRRKWRFKPSLTLRFRSSRAHQIGDSRV